MKKQTKLKCQQEPPNEEDKNAVSIIRADSVGEDSIVGHIPKTYSRVPNNWEWE